MSMHSGDLHQEASQEDYPVKTDAWMLLIPVMLTICGLFMIASITMDMAEQKYQQPFYYLFRQGIFALVSWATGLAIFRFIPIRFWFRMNGLLLLFSLWLLIVVLVPGAGVKVNGSLRWLDFQVIRFQPAELLKISLLAYLAGYLSKHSDRIKHQRIVPLEPLLVFALITFLLSMQPEFTAVFILFAVMLSLFIAGGLAWRWLMAFFVTGVMLLATLVYHQPYRLKRLSAVLDPWSRPLDEGYQITQALLAIGRGDWLGTGLGNSIQKSFYLPEAHTDFLFAIMVEELGTLSGCIMIVLFTILVIRIMMLAIRAKRLSMFFTYYFVLGIAILFTMQIIVNLGVNLGIMPVTGLPLPFLSYGGSHLLITIMLTGVCLRADYEIGIREHASDV